MAGRKLLILDCPFSSLVVSIPVLAKAYDYQELLALIATELRRVHR